MLNDFDYIQPESLSELLEIMENNPRASLLAGGTDLIVDMTEQNTAPEVMVDIKHIPALDRLEEENGELFIGAAVTCSQFLRASELAKKYELVSEAVSVLGSHQIRNRATIVGNICTSSPGADIPLPMLVLGASVDIAGPEGERQVDLENFFTGVKTNVLNDDEFVMGVRVKSPAGDGRGRYRRKTRTAGPDLSACGVAGYMSEKEEILNFAFGAVAPTPLVVKAGELIFKKNLGREEVEEKLLDRVSESVRPITDVRSTAAHRSRLVRTFTGRILQELWKEGEQA